MSVFSVILNLILIFILIILYNQYIRIKEKYSREADLNNLLIEISKELMTYKDVNKIFKKILFDTLKIIPEGNAGSILVYNKKKDCMEYVAAIGYDIDELKKVNLKKEELYLYKLVRLNSAYIIKNPRSFDSEHISNEKYNMLLEMNALDIKSTLSAPIYIEGEFYGVINIDNHKKTDAFTNKDIELLEFLVKQLEASIKNVILLEELKHALKTDKLTNVYNREYFEEILDKEIKRAIRYENSFSIVLIDLDDFKSINDTYGHKIGDRLLKYFADVLKKNLRDTDVVARLGGDEFILLLHGADENKSEGKIEFIKNYLKENPIENIVIDFSYGICQHRNVMDIDSIIIAADDRMYQQKNINKARNQREVLER